MIEFLHVSSIDGFGCTTAKGHWKYRANLLLVVLALGLLRPMDVDLGYGKLFLAAAQVRCHLQAH